MDDLISRQAAIDELHKCQTYLFDSRDHDSKIFLEDAECVIQSLPSAEPRWIPVTERLPEYGNYLVSFQTDEEIDIGTYNPRTGLWSACDADGFYYVASKGLEVVAWAPLPKPYKEEEYGEY